MNWAFNGDVVGDILGLLINDRTKNSDAASACFVILVC